MGEPENKEMKYLGSIKRDGKLVVGTRDAWEEFIKLYFPQDSFGLDDLYRKITELEYYAEMTVYHLDILVRGGVLETWSEDENSKWKLVRNESEYTDSN